MNKRAKLSPPLLLLYLMLFASTSRADDRIPMEATINGQSVHLALDTGSPGNMIFASVAKRLGLKTSVPATTGPLMGARLITESVDLKFFSVSVSEKLDVFEDWRPGNQMDVDGVIGWGPLRDNVMAIDAAKQKFSIAKTMTQDVTGWVKLPLRPKCPVLRIELPGADGKKGYILIDTGVSDGVSLNARRWKQWQTDHSGAPATLTAISTLYEFVVVRRQEWAPKLSFGAFELNGVPVQEANTTEMEDNDYEATFGLYALRRLNLVVDGGNRVAYLRPSTDPPPAFVHNRLGALFVPTSKAHDDRVAHVVEKSPAYVAGIRDGDVLLKIDRLDITRWKTDPNVGRLGRFWEQPAGTKMTLTLRRDQKEYQTEVTLDGILVPTR